MTRRERPATRDPLSPAAASPLWDLVLILGEIAERVERRRAEDHTAGPPATRPATEVDSAAERDSS